MSQDRQDWQTTMAQFYVRLYVRAWENLVPFPGYDHDPGTHCAQQQDVSR